MPKLSKRVQVLMGEGEFSRLQRLAKERHTSVGSLLRSGVQMMYFHSFMGDQKKRQEALQRLFALHAPVTDWPTMKKRIQRTRFKD